MKLNKKTMTVLSVSVKVIIVCVVALFVYKGASVAYQFGYDIFMDEAAAGTEQGRTVEVSLLEGSSARDIGRQLESLGVIKDANVFYIQTLLAGCSDSLKGGQYTLSTSMTPSEIMEILQEGPDGGAEQS